MKKLKSAWRILMVVSSKTDSKKIYGFLGLAAKAGKIISGSEACEYALKNKRVYLVVIAQDASDNLRKSFADMCANKNTDIRIFGDTWSVGRYIGKNKRAVVAVTGEEFAGKLIELIDVYNCEGGGGDIGKNESI
jgi:ribosomal protein L7Ae-like RNA K-turn-binding protein